jgi:hypothetical protein
MTTEQPGFAALLEAPAPPRELSFWAIFGTFGRLLSKSTLFPGNSPTFVFRSLCPPRNSFLGRTVYIRGTGLWESALAQRQSKQN